MAIFGPSGPLVVFGSAPSVSGNAADNNPNSPSPSLFDRGVGLLDARAPFTYAPGGNGPFYGYAGGLFTAIDAAPAALAANNIAASQVPVALTALTLVSSTAAGITVGSSVVNASSGATVTGLLAIDGAAGAVPFPGSGGQLNIWDPTKCLARCVRVVSAGDDSGATFLVSGYDTYGYPMTQLLTGANAGTATTTKAFKYIASVLPAGTLSGSAVTVGTTDVWGLPLLTSLWGYLTVYWNNTLLTAATGFTAAVTTNPSTNLLGDVRGTYANQGSASNGTIRLQMFWRPNVANLLTNAGIWGVAQV